MRLQSYPNSSDFFARLHDLSSTNEYYFVVIEAGFRQILSEILDQRHKYHWLTNLGEPGRRRPLWEGLSRIADALTILHREGMLHRSLSSSAILANAEGNGDFRMSGFEWSLRVSAADDAVARASRRTKLQPSELERDEPEYSTATDWFDFDLLACDVLALPINSINNREGLRRHVNDNSHLRKAERELILALLSDNDFEDRLSDPLDISKRLADIIRDLQGVTVGSGRSLILAVSLGQSRLANAVETASRLAARSSDPLAQRQWIEHDLRGDIRISARISPRPTFVLRGEKLEYRVSQWTFKTTPTWEIGHCTNVEFRPKLSSDDREYSLGDRKVEIMLFPRVADNVHKIRGRSAPWDKVFGLPKAKPVIDPYLRSVHDFFRVTQQLDTLLTIAQIAPVVIVNVREGETYTEITVTPTEEPERNNLARLLQLPSPSEQIQDGFEFGSESIAIDDYDDPKADVYTLLSRATITGDPIADDL